MVGTNNFLRRRQELVNRHGWTVTAMYPTDNAREPSFAYTIGLTAHGRPELIIGGTGSRHRTGTAQRRG
ncbi:DUF4262 domain-containing protein [Phytohabitans aurantiacus]|uniref:DUF4262 domain-containing protein n=1 Tax=Phytohabitans aurantiacus TaxID=3016789 RepID=A0ABQ5QYN8_9ACTN|nr:hypothetical protein Pa4123_40790 [Phytohabitans aurantiacus]